MSINRCEQERIMTWKNLSLIFQFQNQSAIWDLGVLGFGMRFSRFVESILRGCIHGVETNGLR